MCVYRYPVTKRPEPEPEEKPDYNLNQENLSPQGFPYCPICGGTL